MTEQLVNTEGRLKDFEAMLKFVQDNYEDTVIKMEKLKSEGKTKTATYGQLMGNKLTYQNMIAIFKLYDLI